MHRWIKTLFTLTMLLSMLTPAAQPAKAQEPVVRAVLFYSPTCGFCHQVLTEILPPLKEKYGKQLEILEIDATLDAGGALYLSTVSVFEIKSRGVPMLVVGNTVLLGSTDIPEKFPGLIEQGLSQGGIDWPAIPGLEAFLPQASTGLNAPTPTPVQANSAPNDNGNETAGLTILQRFGANFQKDRAANTVAVVILIAMLVSVVAALIVVLSSGDAAEKSTWIKQILGSRWVIPILCAFGIIVAGYLTYIEVTHNNAVCGPIGDCNAVQQSPYALILGFLPVGVLGLMGYIAILVAWVIQSYGPQKLHILVTLGAWGMALFGVFFSIYLTFLEPFVIGASCAWCLTSAVIITLLMWSATPAAQEALGGEGP